jgi:hypothetical protein
VTLLPKKNPAYQRIREELGGSVMFVPELRISERLGAPSKLPPP